jgi:hypothetical protein
LRGIAVRILFWIVVLLIVLVILIWIWARRGFPCILCDLLGPHKPPFGPDRAPPRRGSVRIPSDVYKRADPLIYSQQFLSSQGLAVTWDNPDIHIETVGPDGKPSGTVVPSSELTADTDFFVIARIWNGSVEAPAVNLPVEMSFLSFGVGATSTPIGVTHVDLPVKGVAGCPAFAALKWHTPATPGHYCLQVRLIWADDAEPGNNMGQENTQVKALNSPHAAFDFLLRNEAGRPQVLRLSADFYRPGARPTCPDDSKPAANPHLAPAEIALRRRTAASEHGRDKFPVLPGWTVKIVPEEVELQPVEERTITVDVTAPDGFAGQQAVNVNAFLGDRLAGGVTFVVTGDGS